MENRNNKKTLVIAISTLLALAGIVCEIVGNIKWSGAFYLSPEVASYIIMFIATMYYVLIGYKKPHGNLLRWTFLLLSLTCLNGIINTAISLAYDNEHSVNIQLYIIGLYGIAALLIAYMAGRLDKIKKNYLLIAIITAALLAKVFLHKILYELWYSPIYAIWAFSTFFLWIDLAAAYIIRYREHKEAGLADK